MDDKKKRILLIEDEEVMYSVLTKVLGEGGYDVIHVKDGSSALSIVQEQAFDLIVLDLILPGLSGLDVLAKLKKDEKAKEIPVVILSQLSDQESISRAVALGAKGYLVKSDYGLEDLVKKVKNFLK